MRVSCQFYVGPDDCAWCHLPKSDHRFRPCKQCGSSTFLPDPTDRTSRNASIPPWGWRQVDCGCYDTDHPSGWVDMTTNRPADRHTMEAFL